MRTVGLTNLVLTVNIAEDWGGDEPRIVLVLAGINAETDEDRPIETIVFESGILGDSVPDGTTLQVPLRPPRQLFVPPARLFLTIDETRGDAFYLFAQAWDDDQASNAALVENSRLLEQAVISALSSRGVIEDQTREIMRVCEDTVGRDDLLGQAGRLFPFVEDGSVPISMVLTGLDDDASYTLSASVVFAPA